MRAVRVSVVAILMAAVLAACTGSSEPSTTAVVPDSTIADSPPSNSSPSTTVPTDPLDQYQGGVVVIADDQEPPVLNPYAPGGNNRIVAAVSQAHMAGAHDVAPDGSLIAELAAFVPSVGNGAIVMHDDGSMSVTWTVRDGARWSDGEPITGWDFSFTLEYRKAAAECAGEGPDPDLSGRVEAVGDNTFTYRFESTGFQFETALLWVVPEHAVAGTDYCRDWNTRPWPAAGPFVVEEWIPGESLSLVRNEYYWKADDEGRALPYLGAVEFRFFPEMTTIVEEVSRGGIDVARVPPSEVAHLGAIDGLEIQAVAGPILDLIAFQFGPDRSNPDSLTDDRMMRSAIASTLDLDRVVRVLSEGTLDRMGERVADVVSFDELCLHLNRDCAQSPPSVLLTATANNDRHVIAAEEIAAQLEAAGFSVDLRPEDFGLIWVPEFVGWWDLRIISLAPGDGHQGLVEYMNWLNPAATPDFGVNVSSWGTKDSTGSDSVHVERVRAILDEVADTADAELADRLAAEHASIAGREVVVIPLGGRSEVGAVWASQLDGFEMNATSAAHTWNIEAWRRLDL